MSTCINHATHQAVACWCVVFFFILWHIFGPLIKETRWFTATGLRVLLPIRCILNSMEALLQKDFFQQGNTPMLHEQNCPGTAPWTWQWIQFTAIDCPVTRFQSNWASAGRDWTFGAEIYFQSTWCYCGKHWSQHWLASPWNPSDKMCRLLPNKLTLWRGQDRKINNIFKCLYRLRIKWWKHVFYIIK